MIFDQVKTIIVEIMGIAENDVVETAYLIDDLGADSLDAVELSIALQEEFEIEIEDDDILKMHTVGDIVHYIKERQV
ncbi:MAG: acyl carrier protein [Clostridiaceae bacterium]|jgi:acyl carrier protein|nr:acyl carrier protein [Bacillota bacterium]NLN51977.1 acyl carrier protein [Clostridiaceae bacterium]